MTAGRKNKDGQTPRGKGARQRVQGWRQGRSRRKGRPDRPAKRPTKPSTLNRWLDRLEQDSWNLELIVSGVTLFLLFGAYEHANYLTWKASLVEHGDSIFLLLIGSVTATLGMGYYVLLGMFLLHLILRGFWIGAIGLRSVSGGFDLPALRLTPRYERWLTWRMGTFDDYILRLEKLSSATFSLAFLLFFAIVSVGIYFSLLFGSGALISLLEGKFSDTSSGIELAGGGLLIVWILFLLFSGIIYLLDFVTFGWLKRFKIFGMLYWPVYRFFGWITLARLYRPLYYNVIDNRFSRRLIGRYLLLTILAMIVLGNNLTPYFYFPDKPSDVLTQRSEVYLDELDPQDLSGTEITLASKYATGDYLELFVPYPRRTARVLNEIYPALRPEHEYSYSLGDYWLGNGARINQDSLLEALSSTLRLSVDDSLYQDVPWLFYEHPVREQPGLIHQLPVYDLPRGRHRLLVERMTVNPQPVDSTDQMDLGVAWDTMDIVYFWR